MSAIKNFFSKKGDRIDGGVAVVIVAGSLLVSGLSMASANTPEEHVSPVPVETVVSGSSGATLINSGSSGAMLGDVASVVPQD